MLKYLDEINSLGLHFYFGMCEGMFMRQLELHPGTHCFGYKCPHCYGNGHQLAKKGRLLKLNDYISLLDMLIGKIELIDVSGIASDPTSYSEIDRLIRAIKERGFICGLHTKGYRMSESLIEALIVNLGEPETFINISLDSWNSAQYQALHGIGGKKQYLSRVIRNLKHLQKSKQTETSKLNIRVSHLLLEENSSLNDIAHVIDLVEDYCDHIKISLPQIRNDGKTAKTFISRNGAATLGMIERVFHDHPKVIVVKGQQERPGTFRYCWAQYCQVVVDAWGNVFPCPQTAECNYKHLSYGNILETPALELFESKRHDPDLAIPIEKMGCARICDRKDVAHNELIGHLLEA